MHISTKEHNMASSLKLKNSNGNTLTIENNNAEDY